MMSLPYAIVCATTVNLLMESLKTTHPWLKRHAMQLTPFVVLATVVVYTWSEVGGFTQAGAWEVLEGVAVVWGMAVGIFESVKRNAQRGQLL